jgi:hypothetical protein
LSGRVIGSVVRQINRPTASESFAGTNLTPRSGHAPTSESIAPVRSVQSSTFRLPVHQTN